MFQITNWERDERWSSLPDDHWAVTEDRHQLKHDLEVLERRLKDGERRIEAAADVGADTETWEEFWIELLHRYEEIYRRLADPTENGGEAA